MDVAVENKMRLAVGKLPERLLNGRFGVGNVGFSFINGVKASVCGCTGDNR